MSHILQENRHNFVSTAQQLQEVRQRQGEAFWRLHRIQQRPLPNAPRDQHFIPVQSSLNFESLTSLSPFGVRRNSTFEPNRLAQKRRVSRGSTGAFSGFYIPIWWEWDIRRNTPCRIKIDFLSYVVVWGKNCSKNFLSDILFNINHRKFPFFAGLPSLARIHVETQKNSPGDVYSTGRPPPVSPWAERRNWIRMLFPIKELKGEKWMAIIFQKKCFHGADSTLKELFVVVWVLVGVH